jgi:hypothetical protein
MVTGPSVSAAARAAGSSGSIRPVTAASPASTASHCPGVIRRASPAAVVEDNPGTGVTCRPAGSARCRSSPVKKSSPASCAAAIPVSSSPAPKPRCRCLTGPTAASSTPITPSRPHSSLTATRPAFGVSDRSGAPIRTCCRFPAAYPIHQIGASPLVMIITSQRSSSQARAAPIGICAAVSPAYSRIRV